MIDETKIKKIAVYCPVELAERIDRLANKGNINRSKMMLNMVEVMVEYLEASEKVGLFQLGILLRDAGYSLADLARKWKKMTSIKGIVT